MNWEALYRVVATLAFLASIFDYWDFGVEIAIFFLIGAIYERLEKILNRKE